MPSVVDSPAIGSANLVHLDCEHEDLALVLKWCDKTDSGKISWNQLMRAYHLGERFQFKHIADMVRIRAVGYADDATIIPLFQFAARNDYLDLAKNAVAAMARAPAIQARNHDAVPVWVYKTSPSMYAVALISAIAMHDHSHQVPYSLRWNRISADFKLGI